MTCADRDRVNSRPAGGDRADDLDFRSGDVVAEHDKPIGSSH